MLNEGRTYQRFSLLCVAITHMLRDFFINLIDLKVFISTHILKVRLLYFIHCKSFLLLYLRLRFMAQVPHLTMLIFFAILVI